MGSIDLVRTYDVKPGAEKHDTVGAQLNRDNPAVFLIDRVWPRGVAKADLPYDRWPKVAAPSTDLRKWFNHDPEKFDEFTRRYRNELDDNREDEDLAEIVDAAKHRDIVLLYSAKDEQHNQAVVLRQWLNDKR